MDRMCLRLHMYQSNIFFNKDRPQNVFTSLVVFISQDSWKFNVKRKVGHFKKNGKLFPYGMVVTLSTQALYLFR